MAWIPAAIAGAAAVAGKLIDNGSDSATTTGPKNGTKKSEDSGQTNVQTVDNGKQTSNSNTVGSQGTVNSGRNDYTSTTTLNSGSVNTSETGPSWQFTNNSGRVDTTQTILEPAAVDRLVQQMLQGSQGLAATTTGQNISGGYNSATNTLLANDLLARTAGEIAVRGAKTVSTIGSSSSNTYNTGSKTTNTIGASRTTSVADNRIGESSSNSTTNTAVANVADPYSNVVKQVVGPRTVNETVHEEGTTTATEKESGIWIVCTELYKQGRMDRRDYVPGLKYFDRYSVEDKRGYYIWAEPSTKHLKKHPNSLYSKFLCSIFNARAKYISAPGLGKKRTLYQFVCMYGVHAFCWTLARTIAKRYIYVPAQETI